MIKRQITIIFAAALFFTSLKTTPTQAAGYFTFDDATKRLTVSTPMMDLKIEGGAIVYVKDKTSGEVLTDTNATTNLPISDAFGPGQLDLRSFLGMTTRYDPSESERYRQPVNESVTFSQLSSTSAELLYNPCWTILNGPPWYGPLTGSTLKYDISVDEQSGEVVITLTGKEPEESGMHMKSVDLPIMNFMKSSVILGNGMKWRRSDADGNDQTGGAPTMAVAEGDNSVLSAWSESDRALSEESIQLTHKSGYDHLVLHDPQDLKINNSAKNIIGGPWRIGTYTNWLSAARRWRVRFEERTSAKPLWQNSISWIRDIHSTFTSEGSNLGADYLNTLANLVPPKNLLYLLWNGDRIVTLGDPTWVNDNGAAPSTGELALIKSHGWRVMFYHPWNLYRSATGNSNWIAYMTSLGWMPTGYKFTPDYAGADDPGFADKTGEQRQQDWQAYWSDVYGSYPQGGLLEIHPAAPKFRDYIVRNFGDYCSIHQCDGCYLDVLGGDMVPYYNANIKVINGEDYRFGEKNTVALIRRSLPNLAMMSEFLNTDLVPYVFYTWQGHPEETIKVNHPIRTALLGSYMWTMEREPRGMTVYPDERHALLGALPNVSLAGDYQINDNIATWSQARAKLFSQDELFNDLPPSWDPTALAYYRTKYGTWMKAKKIGDSDFGYYEEIPGTGDVLRLQKSNPVIIPHPGGTTYAKADLNQDTHVNITDLGILMSDFGKTTNLSNPRSDMNSDGVVNISDLGIMMSGWGS